MAEDIPKELIPFSFDEIEEKVKEALLAKGLTDILYPGSNISQIADIMTYLVHVLNTNTAINLQEVILPLATKRMNVLFGGRQLGYEAVQRTSWRYNLDISLKRRDGLSDADTYNLSIPKYTIFESNGNKYYYMGQDIFIDGITNINRFEKGFNLEIKEGDLIRYVDNDLLSVRAFTEIVDGVSKTKQNYLIPFENVEDDGIETWLTYTDDDGTNIVLEEWKRYRQFLVDSSYDVAKNKFVRLQNIFLQMPSVFFEIAGYGNPIRLNTLIQSNILVSKGIDGKAGDTFTISDAILSDQISTSLGEVIHTGTDVESMESIKENAPVFHNSANRAVTSLDYISITQRHENVETSHVWGVEEEVNDLSDKALTGGVLFSFFPERTKREFLSTPLDSDSNTSDEVNAQNLQYDLQIMPRHPVFPFVSEPADIAQPDGWIPKPVNYLPVPDGWDTFAPGGVIPAPPTEIQNPGQKPLIQYPEERNNWLVSTAGGKPINESMPNDWVENPNISSTFDGVNPEPDLAIIQDATYIALQAEYINTLFNSSVFITNDQTWYQDNQDYGNDIIGGSFNGVTGSGELYKNWLAEPDVITYITWQKSDFNYRTYLQELEEYNSNLAEYNDYVDYLNTPEGTEYNNYYNDLGEGGTAPSCDPGLNQCSSDRYDNYITDLDLYNENREDIDNLQTNWYLKDNEIQINSTTARGESDGTVFSELEPFKIMTMNHLNRQPPYVNFDYIIKIIKYDLSKSTAETNEIIFNVIDGYFDSTVETLNFNYFASNLQRRVDEAIGDSSGVEIALVNDISLAAFMYEGVDGFTPKFGQGQPQKIITKLAFPFENMYEGSAGTFVGGEFLPQINTPEFTLGRTKYEIDLPATVISWNDAVIPIIGAAGDLVMTFNNVGDSNNLYYTALSAYNDLAVNIDFTDTSLWEPSGIIVDVLAGDTTKINDNNSPDIYYYVADVAKSNVNLRDVFLTLRGNPSNPVTDWTDAGQPQALYMLKESDGSLTVPIFTIKDDEIEIPIYLGTYPGDGATANGDGQVGSYFIRNSRDQLFEVHLNFETASGGAGIPEFLCFTDYGFGYMDLIYPSNIDSNSDNIPFTQNVMPRLRQVKFDVL